MRPFALACVFLVSSMGLIGLAISILSALPARGATIPTAQVVGGKRSPIQASSRLAGVPVVVAKIVGSMMIAALVGTAILLAIGHVPWSSAVSLAALATP